MGYRSQKKRLFQSDPLFASVKDQKKSLRIFRCIIASSLLRITLVREASIRVQSASHCNNFHYRTANGHH